MRLPLAVDLVITGYAGGQITNYDRGMTNLIAQSFGDRLVVTQRPAINLFEVAADQSAGMQGRGINYWDATTALYIVNDDTVYKNSYINDIGTIGSGSKRTYFAENSGSLIMTDPENDQGWTIDEADNVTEITDTDFPPNATPSVGLADGVATLNGTSYVLGEDGTIYGSDFENVTAWSALNFITAEREPDGGTYIGKHHDHIVVMGPRTIEFFFDAANATGSPLSRRDDVFYNLGCHDGRTVWAEGDRLFFVAVEPSGSLGVYMLDNFIPRLISTDSIAAYLSDQLIRAGWLAMGAGYSARGHTFYKLTVHSIGSGVVPLQTITFDAASSLWSMESTDASQGGHFPLVAWTVRSTRLPHAGEGILSNGDLITVQDNNLSPMDGSGGFAYVEDGYVEVGYVAGAESTSASIPITVRCGMWDGGTRNHKFASDLAIIADASSAILNVRWANESTIDFSASRDITTSGKITRLGRFRRRNFEIDGAAITQSVRLEAIEVNLEAGSH